MEMDSVAGCVFCGIARGEIPAAIVAESEAVVAFDDLAPKAPVHALVIPREHLAGVHDIRDGALLKAMVDLAREVAERKGVAKSGYRLVFNIGPDAGQSVFHAHLHLLGGRSFAWPPG
jgi:histidine triad (HIT) family protein